MCDRIAVFVVSTASSAIVVLNLCVDEVRWSRGQERPTRSSVPNSVTGAFSDLLTCSVACLYVPGWWWRRGHGRQGFMTCPRMCAAGTTMAVRARAAVADACAASEPRPGAAHEQGTNPKEPLRLFSEVVEPGREDAAVARALHEGGRHAVAIGERLLTGEVRLRSPTLHVPRRACW